jgi:tetratricopeptide (TPR) repeat protein
MLDHPDRLPLVGRESALAEMLKYVEAAAQGAGGLILVYGEAGVGKTRLLRELARNAQWRGIRTAWGRCYELAGPQPYQPLLEVLRTDLSLLSETSLEPLWRAELARLLPELATGESPPPMEPEQEQHRLLEAIARGLLALVRTTPGLILLEDAHWIDPDSLAAIRYLLPRLEMIPLLIVVSARGEELAGRQAAGLSTLERTRLPRRLELGRLTLAESGQLVQHALGLEQPPPRFTARLFAETEGNPFFLTETLRALMDEGLLYRDELGEWSTPWDESTEDYAEMPLPDSVTHSIECRLDLLPAPLRGALDLAAVIGRGVPFALWQQAGDWGEEELLSIGDELCRRGLLLFAHPEMAAGADYVFAHDQIRRVTYEQLAGPRRRLYHARVAERLTRAAEEIGTSAEPGALAYHWTAAQVWDKAADCHQQAGDRAQGVYANAKAVTHYTQALQAMERLPGSPDPVRALELRLARESVLALQGERASQASDLAAAQALAEQLDDAQLARVTLRQARYCTDISDYPGAQHHLERVLAWARAASDRRSEATGLGLLGHVHLRLGDGTRARGYGEKALAIYRSMSDRQREAQSLGACGISCYVAGDLPAAQQYVEQALSLCQTLGDRRGEGLSLYRLGRFSRDLGDLAIARDYLMQALTTARLMGDRQLEAYYQLELGNLYYALGDYAQARETLGSAARTFGQISEPRGEGSSLMDLGLVYLAQGEFEQARSHCEQGLDLLSSVGDRWTEAASLSYLGQVLEGQGDLEAASKVFKQALTINQEADQPARTMRDLAGLARIALAQGRMADARERVQEILSWISVHGIAGIDYPLIVYLTVYRVLAQAGETKSAQEILDEAYTLLMERAGKLGDEDLRRSFLENVLEHREILAAYRELHRSSIRARLPRADAPTGRPLRDDEYVTVTWTVAAPEDEALEDGPARRQAQIQRLLQEAAEQGATPTVGNLAAALDVSEPTVRRDLAALRRAGHTVKTRGSRGG